MAQISHWRCDRCGRECSVRHGDPRYYAPEGYRDGGPIDPRAAVRCQDQQAWCNDCGELRPAELIEDLRSLGLMLELDPSDRVRRLIAWRQARRSPEKCLECGSPRIVSAHRVTLRRKEMEWYEYRIAHPGCGGNFAPSRVADRVDDAMPESLPSEGPQPPRRRWWRFGRKGP